MNKREVKEVGRDVGRGYVTWIEMETSQDEDNALPWTTDKGVYCDNCNDYHEHPVGWMVCVAMGGESNGRQYAGDFSYEIALEPNADSLFEAYEDGIYLGARKEALKRFRQLYSWSERQRINNRVKLGERGREFVVSV